MKPPQAAVRRVRAARQVYGRIFAARGRIVTTGAAAGVSTSEGLAPGICVSFSFECVDEPGGVLDGASTSAAVDVARGEQALAGVVGRVDGDVVFDCERHEEIAHEIHGAVFVLGEPVQLHEGVEANNVRPVVLNFGAQMSPQVAPSAECRS
jgi:hypothetical protein